MWMRWSVHRSAVATMIAMGLMACAEGSEIPEDDLPSPEIQIVDGDALDWELNTGESDEAAFAIENPGDRELEFHVGFEADWLDIEPIYGEVQIGGAVEIVAEATCGDEPGEYEETVLVDHSDPDVSPIGLAARLMCGEPANEEEQNQNDGEEEEEEFGELEVVVDGIPGALDANVTVDGPDDFSADVTQTTLLEEVPPGVATVTAVSVIGAGEDVFYEPDPTEQTVDIEVDTRSEAVVTYAVEELGEEQGTLDVRVDGLPAGAAPVIDIEGPDFVENYDGEVVIDDAEPGSYTVTFGEVVHGELIYRVDDSPFELVVQSEQTTIVEGQYEEVGGALEIAVETFGDADFQVSLAGSEGFSETITGASSFDDVAPGTYTATVDDVPVDAEGNEGYVVIEPDDTVDVVSDETTSLTVVAGAATVVATAQDDGPGSLRSILEGSLAAGSTVEFDESVQGVELLNGDITVDTTVEITGDEQASVVIEGGNGGIFRVDSSGFLLLEGVTLRGADTAGKGGALHLEEGGLAIVEKVVFENNSAGEHGGAIFIDDAAELVVEEAIFRDNHAGESGGALAVESLAVSGQTAVHVETSLFEGNSADADGGAVYLNEDVTIYESTFVDNTAATQGGAIRIWSGETMLRGVTAVDNHAQDGGGIQFFGDQSMALSMGRSVIADNTSTGEGPDIARSVDETDIESLGYNVVGVAGGGVTDGSNGDQAGTEGAPLDPQLFSLNDNGGFSPTAMPTPTSPAKASIPANQCEAIGEPSLPVRDQRGERRPAGAFCNAGAAELDASLETFQNAPMSAVSYESDTFTGDGGVEWTYEEVRRNWGDYVIEDTSVILNPDEDGWIRTETLSGEISSLSMQLAQAFTGSGDRQVEVFVDGTSVGTSTPFFDENPPEMVQRFAVEDIDVSGGYDIEIRSVGDGHVLVDNVTWR